MCRTGQPARSDASLCPKTAAAARFAGGVKARSCSVTSASKTGSKVNSGVDSNLGLARMRAAASAGSDGGGGHLGWIDERSRSVLPDSPTHHPIATPSSR
jgi:hypothetical protein